MNQESGDARQPAPGGAAIPDPGPTRVDVPGERGIAPLNAPRRRRLSSLLLALVSVMILGFLIWKLPVLPDPRERRNTVAATPSTPDSERRAYRDQDVALETTEPRVKTPPPPPIFTLPPVPKIDPQSPPAAEPKKERILTPAERRLQGGVGGQGPGRLGGTLPHPPAAAPSEEQQPGATTRAPRALASVVPTSARTSQRRPRGVDDPLEAEPAEGVDPASFGAQLVGTRTEGAVATRLGSQTTMLASGRYFECVLDTAISSIVAGQVRCTLPDDVRGEDGKLTLLERGTEIRGEYRSDMRQAQRRLGVVWMRAKTPAGVLIALESPASDTLGRAGVAGFIETYFWERFGAAIMLSTLDDALAAVMRNGGGNTIYYSNSTRTVQRMGEIALQNSINIRPTIVKNQGETVTIALARDLDFRSVYEFRQLGIR